MLEILFHPEQRLDFGLTEHGREWFDVARMRDVVDHPFSAERHTIEEAERRHGLDQSRPGCPLLPEKEELIVADLRGAESIGGFAEVAREGGYLAEVSVDGLLRVIAQLQVSKHLLAQRGHQRLLS